MEFVLSTDLSVLPKCIEFNAEDLKRELQPKLDYYKSMVVTEDGIKEAKVDRANLNLLKSAIDEKRKEVKRQWLVPYESFEVQCKELASMIDAPISAIDTQIKAFDEIRKQEKWTAICEFWNNIANDMDDTIMLDRVVNPKWKNATMKLEDVKLDLSDKLDRIREDLHTIDVEFADVPYKAAILSKYKEQFSLSQARVTAAMLHTEEEKLHRRQEAGNRCASAPASVQAAAQEPAPIQEQPAVDMVQNDTPVHGGFVIQCRRSQLVALKAYMLASGIQISGIITMAEYEKIKEERTSCSK